MPSRGKTHIFDDFADRLTRAALLVLLAAPASAQAAPLVRDLGPGIVVETRATIPAMQGPLSNGPTTLQREACASGILNDDTVNEADRSAAKIRAIEVVPSDRESDPAARDAIAAVVADITAHVAQQPGSKRTLRFDVGTRCGPDSVDVHSITLPRTQAAYQENCTTQVFDEVRAALPPAPGPRNAILFSNTFDCGLILGFADAPKDDQPGPANAANRGGYMAIAFEIVSRTALHEIGHNLGAVQTSAPHSDQGAHCYDNDDTMCYAYTAAVPTQTPLLRPCAVAFEVPQPFDCGQDDYFSPAPAAGNYLATHWNTYDSIFMCEISTCIPAPSAPPTSSGPAATAPVAGEPAATRPAALSSPSRLSLAVRATRSGRRRGLVVNVTGSGSARVRVSRGTRTVNTRTLDLAKGRATLRVRLPRGGRYRVTATAVGAGASPPRASQYVRVR